MSDEKLLANKPRSVLELYEGTFMLSNLFSGSESNVWAGFFKSSLRRKFVTSNLVGLSKFILTKTVKHAITSNVTSNFTDSEIKICLYSKEKRKEASHAKGDGNEVKLFASH